MSDISDLVQIARSQIGTEEDPRTRMWVLPLRNIRIQRLLVVRVGRGVQRLWTGACNSLHLKTRKLHIFLARRLHLILLTGRIIIISTCLTRQVAQAGERHKAVISLSTSSRIAESFPNPAMITTISTRSRVIQILAEDETAMKWLNAAATLVR